MKPQNKFQKQIVEASRKLKPISREQVLWGIKHAIDHYARRTAKGVVTCTECGHTWNEEKEIKTAVCAGCSEKLVVKTTRDRVFNGCGYMTVIDACCGYQVVRTVMFRSTAKVGYPVRYEHSEVMQRWLATNGKYETFAQLRQTQGTCYIDKFFFHSDLELRQENTNNKYCLNIYDRIGTGVVHPEQKLIPELKRAGLKKRLFGQRPLDLYRTVLSDPRAETLIKAGQTKVLQRIMDKGWDKIADYWPSIRIAIRNGYKIKDAALWCDLIDFLRYLNKDLHNAKYVCPADLHKAHDYYMKKKQALADKRQREADIEEIRENEANYSAEKRAFFGLQFTDGEILVRVIESVEEMIAEGKAMHHCVGSYHKEEDSLILSATIDGKRIETVEVSLSQLKVTQCRGVCNKNTKHHSRIVRLVNDNMPLIETRKIA